MLIIAITCLGIGLLPCVSIPKNTRADNIDPTANIVGQTLSLESNIHIKYAIDYQNIAEGDDYGLLLWNDYQETYEYGTQNKILYPDSMVNGYPVCEYKELSAKQMTVTVYARAFIERNGVYYYSTIKKYSILEYAYNKLGKTEANPSNSETLIDLLNGMLSYGGLAQKYFNYKTDNLASDNYTYVRITNAVFADGMDYGLFKTNTAVEFTIKNGFILDSDKLDIVVGENGKCTFTVPEEKVVEEELIIEERYSEGLSYTKKSNYYVVSGMGTCTDTEVSVPAEYNGLPVKEIGTMAFSGKKSQYVTSIRLPDTITTLGYGAFSNCWVLESIKIPDSVTSFGDNMFQGDTCLVNVELPNNLVTVGSSTFSGCTSLKNVKIPEGLSVISYNMFYNCSSLAEIEIPNSVTTIESNAFTNCTSLKSIEIPDSVKSIGSSILSKCNNIESVVLPRLGGHISSVFNIIANQTVNSVPTSLKFVTITGEFTGSFENCSTITYINIPNATKINEKAFYNCKALTAITINENVNSIGKYAFYDCTNLEKLIFNAKEVSDFAEYNDIFHNTGIDGNGVEVIVGKNVKKIPAYMFQPNNGNNYSPKILSVDFESESQCESIGINAFAYLSDLSEITIDKNVKTIGERAFYECSNLKEITFNAMELEDTLIKGNNIFYKAGASNEGINLTIGENVKLIPNYLFNNSNDNAKYAPNIIAVNFLENSVCNSIGIRAFAYLENLQSINIPSGIVNIGDEAFYNCKNLLEVDIPQSITELNNGVFYGCSSLLSVKIPNNVTSIGEYAFYNCKGLTDIKIPEKVSQIGSYAFYNCEGLTKVDISNIKNWCELEFAYYGANPLEYAKNLYLNNEPVVDLVLTEEITKVGQMAFRYCETLQTLTVSESVQSFGTDAFSDCPNLEGIYLNDLSAWCTAEGATPWAPNLYLDGKLIEHLVIPNDITIIRNATFSKAQCLKSVTLHSGVTTLEGYAFGRCDNIEEVNFSTGLETIDYNAFESCKLLKEVVLPEGLKSIGAFAFEKCESLTNVIIPESLERLGQYAFSECKNIVNLRYNAIDCELDADTLKNAGKNTGINLVIGKNVKNIPFYTHGLYPSVGGNVVFVSNIVSVVFEEFSTCESIGGYIFQHCWELQQIVIPKTVKSIGEYAFYDCTKLTSIIFEGTVEEWNAIEKGESWCESILAEVVICQDGNVSIN